jgi:hypothetical protein
MFACLSRGIDWMMAETPNLERLSIASSVPVYLGLAIFHTLKTHDFNGGDFGAGLAALVGGISGAIGLNTWVRSRPGGRDRDGPGP